MPPRTADMIPVASPATVEHRCWSEQVLAAKEARFLDGGRPFWQDGLRAVGILGEFLRGFVAFRSLGRCATVFGSSRKNVGDHWGDLAYMLGRRLAERGFTVMTGGGPGLMAQANRGAREAGGLSIGCGIKLRTEHGPNPWVDRWIEFHRFFVRKVMLVKYSCAFVVLPGGFGTLDELFEAVTLRQTGKIHDFPVILMGRSYWAPLLELVSAMAHRHATIDPSDLASLLVTDSVDEAVACIVHCATRRFGLACRDAASERALPEPRT